MTVRVRGIHTTALTARLTEAGWTVAQPSDPIADRFDAEFEAVEAHAWIDDSPDRLGIIVVGDPAVQPDIVDELADIGRDAFVHPDPNPPGTVLDGTVDRTAGGGAIVDLPETAEGYLPFSAIDAFVDKGDTVRLQVAESAPPWAEKRPVLREPIRAPGNRVSLEAGADRRVLDAPDRETHGLADLLDVEIPEGWGMRWHEGTAGMDLSTMEESIEVVVDRARRMRADAAGTVPGTPTEDTQAPKRVAEPLVGTWIRFGRESRMALDEARGQVVPTMTGHHRVKAMGSTPGTAVDFLEAVMTEDPPAEFPFEAVRRTFGPAPGDTVAIAHGKPTGEGYELGEGTVVDIASASARIDVERELEGGGTYDGLDVPIESGDTATTGLVEGQWWYPTVYRSADGTVKGTYVNICTPLELFPEAVRYVDLYIDVIKHRDGTVEIVDAEELAAHVDSGDVPKAAAEKARTVAESIRKSLE